MFNVMQNYDVKSDDYLDYMWETAEECCICGRSIAECQQDLDLEFYFNEDGRIFCMDHYQESTQLELW